MFQSVRDPQTRNGITAEIIVPVPYEPFCQWESTVRGKRPAEYLQMKERVTTVLLKQFLELFPELTNSIAYTELGTPLTFRDYCNHTGGSLYGMGASPEKLNGSLTLPASPVNGLYFTGGDVFSHGIFGAFTGGVITASSVLNKNLFRS